MRNVSLVTFATKNFTFQQQSLVHSARSCANIYNVSSWTESSLRSTRFFLDNSSILREKKGAGFWLWKPYIILEELCKNDKSEFVCYYDVGRGRGNQLPRSIEPILNWADAHNFGVMPGVFIPECGPNGWWTKRDAFVVIGCDTKKYIDAPQVQATFSVWRKTNSSREFVEAWLDYCCDRRVLSDDDNVCGLPNYPGFIEHRHDQSVLTLLCIKYGIQPIGTIDKRTEKTKNISVVIEQIGGFSARAAVARIARGIRSTVRQIPILADIAEHFRPRGVIQKTLNSRGY